VNFKHATIAAFVLLAGSALGLAQFTPPPCSNATLHGDYAFTITGQIFAPAPAAGFVSGVAMTHYDGAGHMKQVDHVMHNGVAPLEEWRPGSGPYQVNPDCTGYMIINAEPNILADSSPPLRVEFTVSQNGNLIKTVVTGSPANPLLAPDITSTGTRVYQPLLVW
jgi:hypothetical protein